ncbi:LysR family transcriptional regulator [Tunturiibacter psychrotolerans]|uniref:LysR family transcriptional regulator n=1 Tax=Tunturiibacter psychrotolerans TaxID=3069686 RepID=UPI003D1A978F
MNGIDIRLLQAAIAAAEELSFSRAAARIHITQPALSKQIHDLESHPGVPLFNRDNQRVELTDACRAFIEQARLSVLHLERAIHQARSISKGAEAVLHIGTSPSVDPYLLSTLLSIRLPLFPKLMVYRSSNFSAELGRQVMTGELEIALLTAGLSTPRLNFLNIASAPFYVVVRNSNQLAKKREVRLRDCHERPWILFGRHLNPSLYETFMSRAKQESVSPLEIHHITTAEESAHFLAHHDGVAFLTHDGAWRIARNGLAMRPLIDDELRLRTALVTRADDRTRLVSEFVRAVGRKIKSDSDHRQQQLALTG